MNTLTVAPAPSPVRTRSGPLTPSVTAGRDTAVVIGGGYAGLLAAWALRGFAERIVIVERDRYPDTPDFRDGVLQGHHAHPLFEAGHRALEQLMPGIRDHLRAAGATRMPMSDLDWFSAVGPLAEYPSRLSILSCTRALLDHTIGERVRREPSIDILDATDVVEVLGTPHTVTGVRTRERGCSSRAEDLPAQLVVDASGRGSRMPEWLRALGAAPVTGQFCDPGAAFLSRTFYRPASYDLLGYQALFEQAAAPNHPYAGTLVPVEGNRMIVTLSGLRGHEPGAGEAGFDKALARLRSPLLREALQHAEPASAVRGFRPKPAVRRHYHRNAPDGLVAIGDAACTTNHTHGMTIAALGAQALERAAASHGGIGHATARAARRGIHTASRQAWAMAAADDARFPATRGGPSHVLVTAQRRYLDRALARASSDPKVAAALHDTMALVASPTALLRPAVLGSVLLGIG